MSFKINNNSMAINAQRNLYVNNMNMSKTMEKLSSGLRIVRAADGPASLVISEQMRSQIKGIEQAIRNSETGIAMMQTTEAAMNEVNRMLTSLRQLAVHAANEAVNDEFMLEADQQEVVNILSSIDRIARDTSFGNKKVLDGTAGADGVATGAGLELVKASNLTEDSGSGGFDVVITQAAGKTAITGTQALTRDMAVAGEKLTIVENGKEATVIGTEEDTELTLISRLQSIAERNGLDVRVSVDATGLVSVEHKKFGSKHDIKVYSDTTGVLSPEGGSMASAVKGRDVEGSINGELAKGEGRILSSLAGNPTTEGLVVRYMGDVGQPGGPEINEEQGTKVGTVHITQNSLRFQLGDSYDQNGSISLESLFTSELGNGVPNESGFLSLRDIDLRTFEGANDALKIIESAANKVSTIRGDIGAFQKNLLESNLNSMMVMRESMVFSESTIRDADYANEVSNLTKNQIMQQTGVAVSSHANENPKAVLKLLQ